MADNNQAYSFPDENVSAEEKKSKDWLLAFARAAMSYYNSLPFDTLGWGSRDRYEMIKTYANGRQQVDKYKKLLTPGEDPSNNPLVVDWKVPQVIPRFRRIVLGVLEKQNYYLEINPIDPLAKGDVEIAIETVRSKLQIREQLKMMGMPELANNAPLALEQDEPEDLDGLSVMELGIRHRTAMEVEQLLQLIYNDNKFGDIRNQYLEDLFDYGIAVLRDYKNGDTVGIRRCDPRRLVISFCSYPDFRDLKYIGEVQVKTASQIVSESNGELSEEDMKRVWQQGNLNNGSWGANFTTTNWPSSFSDFWGRGKIYVLDLEIYSSYPLEREEKEDRRGNTKFRSAEKDVNKRKEKQAKGVKYHTKNIQDVYRVKWIVGTDMIYDYGRQYDVKRNPKDKSCVIGSFHIRGCSIHDMYAFSRTEQMVSPADAIYLATMRLQHTLNTVVPSGYAIDFSALEDVAMGHGGEAMSPKEILDLFFQRGILAYRSVSLTGQGNEKNSVPISPTISGVGNEIAEYWNLITNKKEEIRSNLGLNELTDASTPDQKTLNGVASLAQQGTNNALSDLFLADKALVQSLAASVIVRAQDIIRTTDAAGFVNALGRGTVTILKNIPDIYKYIYSVEIIDTPTVEEEAAFNQSLQNAISQGQITVADELQLKNIKNFKQKEMFLAYRVRKSAEKKQQDAMQMQQQNGQIQVQSAQAAEQAKQQTLQMEWELRMKFEQMSKDLELRNEEVRGQIALEGKRIDATGRVEASAVQATERQAGNIRNNTTKLISDNREDQIPQVSIPVDLHSNVTPATSDQNPILDIPGFSFLQNEEEQNQPLELNENT